MTLRCRRRRRRGPGRGGPRGPCGEGGARARVGARRGADPGGRSAGAASGRRGGGAVGRPAGQGRDALPFGARGAPCPPGFGCGTGVCPGGRGARPLPASICLLSFPVSPRLGLILCLSFPCFGSRAREENSRKLEPHRSPVKMKVSGANSS